MHTHTHTHTHTCKHRNMCVCVSLCVSHEPAHCIDVCAISELSCVRVRLYDCVCVCFTYLHTALISVPSVNSCHTPMTGKPSTDVHVSHSVSRWFCCTCGHTQTHTHAHTQTRTQKVTNTLIGATASNTSSPYSTMRKVRCP